MAQPKAVSLIDLARRAGLLPTVCPRCGTKVGTERALERFVEELTKALVDGEVVRIKDFGLFEAHMKKGGALQTPLVAAGVVVVPDKRVVKFRGSKTLKAAMQSQPSKRKAS